MTHIKSFQFQHMSTVWVCGNNITNHHHHHQRISGSRPNGLHFRPTYLL